MPGPADDASPGKNRARASTTPVVAARTNVDPRLAWSVMVPAWNCAELLGRTLESILSDDPGPESMHIEVVDDASTDDPAAVVDTFDGRVSYWRQPTNVGAIANFNACIERSQGEFVHILHGDDLVKPGFHRAAAQAFDAGAEAFVSRADHIDEHDHITRTTRSEQPTGLWPAALETLTVSNRVVAAAIAVRRSVYEAVGGFRTDLPHAADWEMWTRIAANHPVWFEDRSLAQYREHGGQDTSGRVLSGENIRERRTAIDMLAPHVEAAAWPARRRKALGYSALFAGRTAVDLVRAGEVRGALAQTGQAAVCLLDAVRGPG